MEFAIRFLVYMAVGLALLVANLWFARSVYRSFLSSEYVIAPFNVIDPTGKVAGDKAGLALAQMMVARLSNLQTQLSTTQSPAQPPLTPMPDLSNPLTITTLFVPRPVEIPTSLFEPVTIKATVGGLEVGGIIAWIQKTLANESALVFTTYERADKAIIAADLGHLAPGVRLWFESDKHPDDIATNAAYALIQVRLTEKQATPIKELAVADFRQVLEAIVLVDNLNRRTAQGHIVRSEFGALLPKMEAQVEKVPNWAELIYLTASIAEGANDLAKATTYYTKLQGLSDAHKARSDARMMQFTAKRLAELRAEQRELVPEEAKRFIKTSTDFANEVGFTEPHLKIAFVKPAQPGVLGIWNQKSEQYEVDSSKTNLEGLAQHVALTGRFLARNFNRCFGETGDSGSRIDNDFWNEFRYSTTDYILRNKGFVSLASMSERFDLFAALKSIEESIGAEATLHLAVEMLKRYDCSWARDRVANEVLKIAESHDEISKSAIIAAMSKHGFKINSPRS